MPKHLNTADDFEMVAIERLKPHPNNVNEADTGAVIESIKAHGAKADSMKSECCTQLGLFASTAPPSYDFMIVEPISMNTARAFVREHHYARTTPSTTRCAYGLYDNSGNLGGVAIWGVGVRPKHTIAKWFPGVETKDYLELNRLCLLYDWPRNSESQFLKIVAAHIKKDFPNVKLLLSWADGLRGKPGFVYQGANWLYGGHISSDFYTDQAGFVLHPRLLITRYGSRGKETVRRLNLRHYFGKQFMYARFLCPRPERETLLQKSPFGWGQDYPKSKDATLTVDEGDGIRRECTTFPTLLGRADNYLFDIAHV